MQYYYGNKIEVLEHRVATGKIKEEPQRKSSQFMEHRNIARHAELWHLQDHDQQQQYRHARWKMTNRYYLCLKIAASVCTVLCPIVYCISSRNPSTCPEILTHDERSSEIENVYILLPTTNTCNITMQFIPTKLDSDLDVSLQWD